MNSLEQISVELNYLRDQTLRDEKIFIYQIIHTDYLYLESFHLKSLITKIINNINFYLREDFNSYLEFKMEHIDQFNLEEYELIFKDGNKDNKNKKIAFQLFTILKDTFNSYEEIKKTLKN